MTAESLVPLSTANLIFAQGLGLEIYIEVQTNAFVQFRTKDQPFHSDDLTILKHQNVSTVHLTPESFEVYANRCLSLARAATSGARPLQPQARARLLIPIMDSIFREFAHLGPSDEGYRRAHTIAYDMLEMIEADRGLSQLLKSFDNLNDQWIRHCLGTSALISLLAYSLGWQGHSTLLNLSLAGLFHDIGFRELPASIRSKPLHEMTPDEVELYRSHPERGRRILAEIDSVPAQVIQMIHEHHELPNGTGFPNGLKFNRIFPLSRTLAFADLIAHELLDPGRLQRGVDHHRDVYLRLESIYRQDFPSDYFRALERLLGVKKISSAA